MKIAVAGTGYVGLSLAVLLSQHNDVTAVDIVPEKVDMINNWKSPIQDDYIEKYLAEHEERNLKLKATTDGAAAYRDAQFVIIAAPTNYDPQKNFFDCSAVEAVIQLVLNSSDSAIMVIKSTIPVGYTKKVREQFGTDRIIFSPEFLRESKALYDNLYPSRIIVGCDENSKESAEKFAGLLVRKMKCCTNLFDRTTLIDCLHALFENCPRTPDVEKVSRWWEENGMSVQPEGAEYE